MLKLSKVVPLKSIKSLLVLITLLTLTEIPCQTLCPLPQIMFPLSHLKSILGYIVVEHLQPYIVTVNSHHFVLGKSFEVSGICGIEFS